MKKHDFDIEWREHPVRGRCCTAKLNKSAEWWMDPLDLLKHNNPEKVSALIEDRVRFELHDRLYGTTKKRLRELLTGLLGAYRTADSPYVTRDALAELIDVARAALTDEVLEL